MLLWVVFQVNLTFATLQELHRTMRKLQGHPTDLFLNIYALQENFAGWQVVEKLFVFGRKGFLGNEQFSVSEGI